MDFLRDTYAETGSLNNWSPTRFENSRGEMARHTRIWEEFEKGKLEPRIVAIANPKIEFLYFIQIHPEYSYLEGEIVRWIEDHSEDQKPDPNKELKLSIVSLDGNLARETALQERGFEKGPVYGILRLRSVDAPIPNFLPPDGFEIRSVRHDNDFDKISEGIRVVFGHGDWFTGEVLEGISKASFYQRDLDLVAVTPDGSIAAFCTFRIDPMSGITELEPIGTLPRYRRLGLAKALLSEGFMRLRKYDPTILHISGAAYTPEANRLFEVTGFDEACNYYFWHKMI
jgi:ribosomal protein S18 acetylase RimI-like enzyme